MKYTVITTYIDKTGNVTCVKTHEIPLGYKFAPVRIVKLNESDNGVIVTKLETTSETLMEV